MLPDIEFNKHVAEKTKISWQSLTSLFLKLYPFKFILLLMKQVSQFDLQVGCMLKTIKDMDDNKFRSMIVRFGNKNFGMNK